jgi:hypothetical protein
VNPELAKAYAKWRSDFESVMDPALYTINWLDREVWSGRAMFDCTEKSAIVTEWRHYPTGAFDLHGLVAAGDLKDISDTLIPRAVERARLLGASGAIVESREGWAKVLREQGFEPYQTAVRKVLI